MSAVWSGWSKNIQMRPLLLNKYIIQQHKSTAVQRCGKDKINISLCEAVERDLIREELLVLCVSLWESVSRFGSQHSRKPQLDVHHRDCRENDAIRPLSIPLLRAKLRFFGPTGPRPPSDGPQVNMSMFKCVLLIYPGGDDPPGESPHFCKKAQMFISLPAH